MSDSETVLLERMDRVATLTLNRPERLNAVNRALYERLDASLEMLEADDDVRAIVLTGSGRTFCSGADLKDHGGGGTSDERRAYIALGQRVHRRLQTIRKPVVAAVHGAAIGAGVELALACDLIVVAVDARLRFPEVAIGTVVGGGTTFTLVQRVGIARARELLFFGDFIDGEAAAAMGLANRAVAAEDVLGTATAWAIELAGRAPLSLASVKRLLDGARARDADRALAAEAEALLACMESADWAEGKRAFDERRPPRFTGG